MDLLDEIKQSYRRGSVLIKLIFVNVGVFIFVNLISLIFFLTGFDNVTNFALIDWLAVPANLTELLYKPWTIITYMFLHTGFFHILFNMLWLYWFGIIFLKFLSEKQLLSVYILGGIAGAALYILAYNVFPVFSTSKDVSVALGASASVMAVVIAISFFMPNYTINLLFIGRIKLYYIAIFAIGLDILSIQSSNAGGHIAHLGGALFGYLFIRQYKNGTDLTKGLSKFLDNVQEMFKPKPKMKVTYKSKKNKKSAKSETDFEYNKRQADTQKEIDRILDKISRSGYKSLTKAEKELLFRQGDKP
jgi:membrane associated rhomboid family serine protease